MSMCNRCGHNRNHSPSVLVILKSRYLLMNMGMLFPYLDVTVLYNEGTKRSLKKHRQQQPTLNSSNRWKWYDNELLVFFCCSKFKGHPLTVVSTKVVECFFFILYTTGSSKTGQDGGVR